MSEHQSCSVAVQSRQAVRHMATTSSLLAAGNGSVISAYRAQLLLDYCTVSCFFQEL